VVEDTIKAMTKRKEQSGGNTLPAAGVKPKEKGGKY